MMPCSEIGCPETAVMTKMVAHRWGLMSGKKVGFSEGLSFGWIGGTAQPGDFYVYWYCRTHGEAPKIGGAT